MGKDEDATAVVLVGLLVPEPVERARGVERLHRLARLGISFGVTGLVVSHVVHLRWGRCRSRKIPYTVLAKIDTLRMGSPVDLLSHSSLLIQQVKST